MKGFRKDIKNLFRFDAIRISKLLEIAQYTILAFILGFFPHYFKIFVRFILLPLLPLTPLLPLLPLPRLASLGFPRSYCLIMLPMLPWPSLAPLLITNVLHVLSNEPQ